MTMKTYTNQHEVVNEIYTMLKEAGLHDIEVRLASDGFGIHVCGRDYKTADGAIRAAKRMIRDA